MLSTKLLTTVLGGIGYLLRETFSVDDATPVTGTRDAAPGPGNLAFTDTGSKALIADGEWFSDGGTAQSDPMIADADAPYADHAGMYWFARVRLPDHPFVSGTWMIGLKENDNPGSFSMQCGVRIGYNLLYAQQGASGIDTKRTHAQDEVLDFLVVSHGTGSSLWMRSINESRWLRIWTDFFYSYAQVHPVVLPTSSWLKKLGVTELVRGQLDAPYLAATDTASVNVATTMDGQTATAPDADSRIEYTITAATGVTQEIMVRRSDADNGYIIRCDQANSTIAIHKREAGVTGSALDSAARTWTDGTQYRITVVCDGAYIHTWVNNAASVSVTGATFNRSATGISVSHAGADLRIFALRQTIAGTPPPRKPTGGVLLGIGDSKTRGQDDDTDTYPLGSNGFMQRLTADLTTATGNEWVEAVRQGTSSIKVIGMAADIDKRIADTFAYPTHILVNLGANDVGSTSQEDYEAAMAYILDACHARWPAAKIYVSTPWRDIGPTYWDNMHTWIGNVLASRSSWAFRGVDERTTLRGDDNGATYYSDGVHPNAAGHQLYADVLRTMMGF